MRYTIWVQGCSIHCPGCINLDTWDPKEGYEKSIDDIVEDIMAEPGLDGVTITGGEPLDQYDAVLGLCKKLFGKISIFLTTGYTVKHLTHSYKLDIFKCLDIICIGPFHKNQISTNQWKGSSNQVVLFLTPLGTKQSVMQVVPREIYVNPDGTALETGFG